MDWNDPDFVAKTVRVIHAAYDQGVTFFDLADVYGYGKAEVALGEVLKQRPGLRHEIVIQSKCGYRFADGFVVDNSRAHIMDSVESSLKRLGTYHLDVLLLHWPDSLAQPDEVAHAFDDGANLSAIEWVSNEIAPRYAAAAADAKGCSVPIAAS